MVGCLLVRAFPLACELADNRGLAASPAVVVDEGSVEAVSPAAEAYGIYPGQTAREAIGRCPALAVLEARPARYQAAWEDVLRAVEQVVFTFEPAEQGVVYVAIDELNRIRRSVEAAMAELLGCAPPALEPRVGVAATRFAARLAARRAGTNGGEVIPQEELQAFLADQPVRTLPVSAEMHRRLKVLGLEKLGELTSLPQSALAAQFGPEGTLAWRLAKGEGDEPLRPQRRGIRLVERLSFETPLASRQALLSAWEQTLGRLVRQRAFRGLAACQAEVSAATERGRQWSRTITFKEPLADSRRIWSALKVPLEEAEFPGPLGEVVVELHGLEPVQGHQLSIPSARSVLRSRLEEALRQLKARYGYCPVGRVVEVEPWNRVPERRLALIDFDP
jgi:nucleotidyltransferase/DNA polymerase involved in DNA repair